MKKIHHFLCGYWTKIVSCMLSKDKSLNEKSYRYFTEAVLEYNKEVLGELEKWIKEREPTIDDLDCAEGYTGALFDMKEKIREMGEKK